ncbi:MAG: pyrroline-5-carboxylate reductase [Nitrospiraceae bacterium]|nr:MAG: pyrroline-5-carboxylate reductase [Nitrospiraceae bacterium]
MKTGFIGGGNMAEALIKGAKGKILVSEPREDRRQYLEKTYDVETTLSNMEVANSCDIIILAVKPQNMETVLDEISPAVTEGKTVVSIAAGVTLGYLSSRLKTKRLVRVMPNTPALVREGMTVMSLCECFSDDAVSAIREIFMSVGELVVLPEKYMDAVTALSGSGPAFIALFIEAMTEAGTKLGLDEDIASTLAVQTAIGTAGLLKTGLTPAKLREMVTSPGGTTAAGLSVFREKRLNDIVSAALTSARNRAGELGRRD